MVKPGGGTGRVCKRHTGKGIPFDKGITVYQQ